LSGDIQEIGMRVLAIVGAAAAVVTIGGSGAEAARWCAQSDAYAETCGFRSQSQCLATVRGVGGFCRPQAAGRTRGDVPHAAVRAPEGYPTRPYWASPYECYYDEGYGRFRSCNAGGSTN
jgi:hypothetical protein